MRAAKLTKRDATSPYTRPTRDLWGGGAIRSGLQPSNTVERTFLSQRILHLQRIGGQRLRRVMGGSAGGGDGNGPSTLGAGELAA